PNCSVTLCAAIIISLSNWAQRYGYLLRNLNLFTNSLIRSFTHSLINFMHHQSAAQFGFEPGGFRRHYISGIGDVDELLHGNRVEGEGNLHFPAVYPPFQFTKAANATHEIDSLVGTQVVNI